MKKLIIAASIALASSLSFAGTDETASNLTFVNNTDLSSTVKLLSGMFDGYCATEIPFGSDAYTTAHNSKSFDWRTIKLICSNTFPCKAEIYVGNSVSCQPGQGDKAIGNALLNSDGSVTLLNMTSSDYEIQVSGSTITLNQR